MKNKKIILLSATTFIIGVAGLANASFGPLSWPFSAPVVNDPNTNLPNASAGDIAYDSTAGLVFHDGVNFKTVSTTVSSSVVTKNNLDSPYLAPTIDTTILLDTNANDVEVDLPTAVGHTGLTFTIKKIASLNQAFVDPNGTETIDGLSARLEIWGNNESITIISDGSNWRLIKDDRVVAVSYGLSAAQLLPTADPQKILWNSSAYDSHNNMSSGTYTIPMAGKYRVSAMVCFDTHANGHRELNAYKDTSTHIAVLAYDSNFAATVLGCINGSFTHNFALNETLHLEAYQDSSVSLNIGSNGIRYNYIMIERIGR